MLPSTRFCRYQLRTTDVSAARAFYRSLLGGVELDIQALPPAAAARGAGSHWLGHLGVGDVERATAAFVERGAARLGPTRTTDDGGEVAIVRDPGGAMVALATPPSSPAAPEVVWHQLLTTDLARATADYRELFGWRLTERLELGPLGIHQQFSWGPEDASVGSMNDIAGLPGAHPHWLFHIRVAALESALATVGSAGGVLVSHIVLPSGARVAVCDDPQGAAIALRE